MFLFLSVPAGLKQASVREFAVSPEGDSLLLSGNDGYLHVLKLKVCAGWRRLGLG